MKWTKGAALMALLATSACAVPVQAGPPRSTPARAVVVTPTDKCARVQLGAESPYRVPLPEPVRD